MALKRIGPKQNRHLLPRVREAIWEQYYPSPLTGEFIRRKDTTAGRKGKQLAGTDARFVERLRKNTVYLRSLLIVHIDGERYRMRSSNAMWLWVHGDLPEHPLSIDHIDRDGTNDAIHNLRVATVKEQQANRGGRSDNGAGAKFIRKCDKKFGVRLTRLTGEQEWIGTYSTLEEAVSVRDMALQSNPDCYFSL